MPLQVNKHFFNIAKKVKNVLSMSALGTQMKRDCPFFIKSVQT